MDPKNNSNLLQAVRTVGIIKPNLNPQTRVFDQPRLEVYGTGFWLTQGVFITCAHVIQKIVNQPIEIAGMLVVGGNQKLYRKAYIGTIDYDRDLACLGIESNNEQDKIEIQDEIQNGLELYNHTLKVGDKIAYAGFPLGNQLLNEKHSPSYAEGVIGSEVLEEKNGPKNIQISGPIIGGYSGSPIVLKSDYKKVIGIVSNSPSIEAGQASIFRGIHWKHIKALEQLAKS